MSLKPGETAHRCYACADCECDGECDVLCDWDCGCPSYFAPEEEP